jgi:uncharacterized protein (TIGR03437 family)
MWYRAKIAVLLITLLAGLDSRSPIPYLLPARISAAALFTEDEGCAASPGLPPAAKLTLESSFDFGPVAALHEPLPQVPSATFTLENTGCAPLAVSFAVRRTGPDVDGGKITHPDDSALFRLTRLYADGSEARAETAEMAAGERFAFRLAFVPAIPAPADGAAGLHAGQVLPDFVTSVLIITPSAGAPVSVPLVGRVTTGAEIINPLSPRLASRVQVVRAGDEVTVEFAAWDADHDIHHVTYQFVDGAGRAVKEVESFELNPGQLGLLRGQSFTVVRRFASPTPRADALGVIVRLYDGEGHAVATSAPTYQGAGLGLGEAVTVSAAHYRPGPVAAESIVSAFGLRLARAAHSAAALPLPEALAGTRVLIRDSLHVEHAAPLFFVSPTQINFLVPAAVAPGAARVMVVGGEQAVAIGTLHVARVAPGLFAANADGAGVAAAIAVRVLGHGGRVFEPVARYDEARQRFVAAPLDLGGDDEQVFLLLFGSGLRAGQEVRAAVGGVAVDVTYAGAQGQFAGLDQVNLRLPRSLAGHGEADIVLTVDGQAANIVRVHLR